MSQNTPTTASPAQEDAWREIELVVQQITRLSRSELSAGQFFAELLERAVQTLAATGGAVWRLRPEGYALEYQINLAATGLIPAGDSENSPQAEQRLLTHQQLLQYVASRGRRRAISPQAGRAGDSTQPDHTASDAGDSTSGDREPVPQNPTGFMLLICPVTVGSTVPALVEIFQQADASPAAVQGFLRFLGALCELAADFLRNAQLRELEERSRLWTAFEQFTERVHSGLNPRQIAVSIANDGRQLIGCDRVSVALRRGSRYQIVAVSGLEVVDRRSVVVRLSQELIRAVSRTGDSFWYLDTADDADDDKPSVGQHPRQISRPLEQLLDESPARLLAVLPLLPPQPDSAASPPAGNRQHRRSQPVGALLLERFEATGQSGQLRQRADVVARQSSIALANALEYSSLPLLSLLKFTGRIGWHLKLRQLPRTVTVLGMLAAAVSALVLVPGDFTVDGRGQLQPAVRRSVFATADGVISRLNSRLFEEDTVTVTPDDILIELTSSSLDFEQTRIAGELRTAQRSLETTRIERNTVDESDANWQSRLEQLAAQEIEYETLIDSLTAQLAVLKRQTAELQLRSGIAGQVLTWNPVQLLQNRPVRRGERLLDVADVQGEWILEIQVPDQNIGYVHAARGERESGPDVTFVLATSPEHEWKGTVRKIARAASFDPVEGPTVRVTVAIDRNAIPADELRPGASVIPRIHCGTRPIGFIWFHELWHVLRTRILF